MANNLALGIDLGTSKVAALILEADTYKVYTSVSSKTGADLPGPAGYSEQDPKLIFQALERCIQRLPEKLRAQVKNIGVTGQMHGVVLWSSDTAVSNLITWQDTRTLAEDFLGHLQEKCTDYALRAGYGMATLAWLAKNHRMALRRYAFAATIHDYLVYRICELRRPLTDPTNAASWGFYDLRQAKWCIEKVKQAGIPEELLPEIRPSGEGAGFLGKTYAKRWNLPVGTPVKVAIGDNQASLLATLEEPLDELALTLGTGGQLSAVLKTLPVNHDSLPPTVEIRPYLNQSYIAVTCVLCGGTALNWLADSVTKWCHEMEIPAPDKEVIFKKIDSLALKHYPSPLKVITSFMGERHAPALRGSIQGIDLSNFSIGNLSAALALGVVSNLRNMMPEEFRRSRRRIVGSGNGLKKSLSVQKAVEVVFNLPLKVIEDYEEAAYGAARLSLS